MTQDKWYISRRYWSALASMIAAILYYFNIKFDEVAQETVVDAILIVIPLAASVVSTVLDIVSKRRETNKLKEEVCEPQK